MGRTLARWIALAALATASRAAEPLAASAARATPATEPAGRGWLDPSRFSAGYLFHRHKWETREYDNVWVVSHRDPGQGLEARYLNRKAVIQSQFVSVGYELTERVCLRAQAGSMTGGERKTNVVPGDYDPEPAWGVGFDARLWERSKPSVAAIAAFQYNAGKSSDWSRLNTPYEGDIFEWHLDLMGELSASWRDVEFAVLAGAAYSDLQLPYRHTTDRSDRPIREGGYEAEDPFGGLVGLRCRIASRFDLCLRQRVGAVEGFTASAGVDF